MNAYDLQRLISFRAGLQSVSANGSRSSLKLVSPMPGDATRLAILSGSFNPPTSAHALLAERALADGYVVVFVLPVSPAGKTPSGFISEDRLLALESIRKSGMAIGICAHGLYAHQAESAARAFNAKEIVFLAGSDKLFQIFDDVWYEDRDRSLDALFERARVMVAPRGDTIEQIQSVLAEPRNARYAERVEVLPLHPAVGDLSSTRVRGLLASGSDSAGLVPSSVKELCAQTRVFQPPNPDTGANEYELRCRAFDLLWGMGETDSDLFRMLCLEAREPTLRGAQLRATLDRGDPAALQLI
ncbi:MAG: nucleotidyl transferase family protein [Actinomycetota bacterium]